MPARLTSGAIRGENPRRRCQPIAVARKECTAAVMQAHSLHLSLSSQPGCALRRKVRAQTDIPQHTQPITHGLHPGVVRLKVRHRHLFGAALAWVGQTNPLNLDQTASFNQLMTNHARPNVAAGSHSPPASHKCGPHFAHEANSSRRRRNGTHHSPANCKSESIAAA